MGLQTIFYAYILGGLTFIPLLLALAIGWTIYTSSPIDKSINCESKNRFEKSAQLEDAALTSNSDAAKVRKGWLTARKTYEEKEFDGSYLSLVRSYLDSRSKDSKKNRPKDTWYVVLKGNVLYLYEDEAMTECETAIQVDTYDVIIFPEGLPDSELYARRNAICLRPTQEQSQTDDEKRRLTTNSGDNETQQDISESGVTEMTQSWFLFIRSCVEMEDWYFALVHASRHPIDLPPLESVLPVFRPLDVSHVVATLDEQPDVIPMRWLNAMIGRLFFSFYRTQFLESFIVGRLMKKLSKVKSPSFLRNINVTQVSVGRTPPMFSKPMLKEFTKEGDTSFEIYMAYKGEVRITVEADAIISLGQRFKPYSVKLVLAAVLRQLEGNLLVKVKKPPSNRIWYAFTHTPIMDLKAEPVVSERQIKWSVILSTIESKLKEIITDSVVLPYMDDISFFDSSQCQLRGGIWADATFGSHDKEDPSQIPIYEESTGVSLSPGIPNPPMEQEFPLLQRDASEISDTAQTNMDSTSQQRRRKSWYSGDDAQIGSSGDIDILNTSKPGPAETDKPTMPMDGNDSLSLDNISSPLGTVNSRARTRSVDNATRSEYASSVDSGSINPMEGYQSMSPSPSRSDGHTSSNVKRNSDITEKMTSSTVNFLSSLKSKAADRQVLSNTAREAVRKWGSSWVTFKREGSINMKSQKQKDESQVDVITTEGMGLKEERQDEEERSITQSGGKDTQARTDERILVLDKSVKESAQSTQTDGANLLSQDLDNSTKAQFSGMGRQAASERPLKLWNKSSAKVGLSEARLTEEAIASEALVDISDAKATTLADSLEMSVAKSSQTMPIHVQPTQAATMTIPGINAQRKSDIMAIGSHRTISSSSTLTTEYKSRSASINSVYKLFASTSNNTLDSRPSTQQEYAESIGIADFSTSTITNSDASSSNPNTPLTTADTGAGKAKMNLSTPPPLPPRKGTGTHSPASSSTSAVSTPEPAQISASASDVLKRIAYQDEKRRSLESSAFLNHRASLSARNLTSADPTREIAKETGIDASNTSSDDAVDRAPSPLDTSEAGNDSSAGYTNTPSYMFVSDAPTDP